MYTNICARTHTQAQFIHSFSQQRVALRMTELVTHSPVAALIPRGEGERVKRMLEGDEMEGH